MNSGEDIVVWSYWRAVVSYGYMWRDKEINVARYLVMPGDLTMIDVMTVINEMPGTKKRPVTSLRKIDHTEYLEGVRAEKENFFLQRLFEGKEAL